MISIHNLISFSNIISLSLQLTDIKLVQIYAIDDTLKYINKKKDHIPPIFLGNDNLIKFYIVE